MCHTCAKEYLDSNFDYSVIDKISNFHEIAPNSTYSLKSYFFKYICNFIDQLLHPYKFHGRYMSGMLIFIFASCEPLKAAKLEPFSFSENSVALVHNNPVALIHAAIQFQGFSWLSHLLCSCFTSMIIT